MSKLVLSLSVAEIEALCDLVSSFDDARDGCLEHDDGEHGDESECMGWGPTATAALMSADEALSKRLAQHHDFIGR